MSTPAKQSRRRREPRVHVRYGAVQRFADWFAGRSDGRAGLPAIEEDPQSVVSAYHSVRAEHFTMLSEKQHEVMLHAIKESTAECTDLEGRLVDAEDMIAAAEKELEQIPLHPPEDVLHSRTVVEVGLPDELARTRRRREHDKQRKAFVDQRATGQRNLREVRGELTAVRARIEATTEIYRVRVRILHAHAERRCRTYERHLLRHHPAAARLAPLLRHQRPTLPDWVTNLRIAAPTT